jgi:tetratricopeptide (TPR) repeat protein
MDLSELQQARALWARSRFDDSLKMFEQAVRKYPQNLLALTDASRALGARFEITKAEAMIDKLMKLGGNRPEILHLAGQSYRMIYRPEKAIASFEKVVARTKNLPDAYLELAVLYERRHRIEDAMRLVEDCLKADPEYLEALLFKARLLRRVKEEAAAESIFRNLAADERALPQLRAQAWAELAQMLDGHEQYREAMEAMLKCKELMRPNEAAILKDSELHQRQLQDLAESITTAQLQRWRDEAHDFSIHRIATLTGFPRSGTTLLEQVLDAHPGLVSSDEREAFARDIFPAMWLDEKTRLPTASALDAVPRQRLIAQRERYLAYMSAALNQEIGDRVHLDKNPSLTMLIPAILRLFPETRLIVALRDPRDVVISCFMQYLPLNMNSVCFLTLERTAERYAHDMRIWLMLRNKVKSPWLEVKYEDTVADIETAARRSLDFLGLSWDPCVLSYRDRLKEKAVNSPTYEAVIQPVYKKAVNRWKHYEAHLSSSFEILSECIEAFGY